MDKHSNWESLQQEWKSCERLPMPDIHAMIGRARRHRRRMLLIGALEWTIAAAALFAVCSQWQRLAADTVWMACALLFMLVTALVLGVATWTRLRLLSGPSGDSLHDWLAMRRRRAMLGLRLARLTRWTVLAFLPSPVLALLAARELPSTAFSLLALSIPVAVLACGWWWAGRQTVRLQAELREVRALETEWLGD